MAIMATALYLSLSLSYVFVAEEALPLVASRKEGGLIEKDT
jgi:hypothetical protein